ncbi:MAG: hypothetical protein GTO40_29065 [Deltaproteobacteria bacterium]|nr:hypothetical protein [Deltaproteobacteria bacterium]
MKLSVKSLTLTSAILWGGVCLFVAVLNAIWPDYGKAFLDVVSSIYPGYEVAGTLASIVIGTLYAMLDGAVAGALFAWIYNCFAK